MSQTIFDRGSVALAKPERKVQASLGVVPGIGVNEAGGICC